MFQLKGIGTNTTVINLIQNQTKIGRKQGDVLITNDASISRNHAVIDITNDTMKVTDQGSKYGIYINDQKVTQGVLKEGDLLRLGQFDSVYAVQKLQVSICLSGVSDKQKVIDSANAKSIPTVEVVDCTYLVMNELKVTKKVLIAMGRAIHILSPKFVTDITVTNFPDPQNYMPRMAPNLDPQLALPNKRRLTLFKDKTVVFFSQTNVDSFGAVIEAVGGKFVFKANTKVCKCGGCEDILCMSTYCACSNVDCLNLHIYFVQESKTRDRYYNAIYKEFPSMFITTEAISLCILECDFSKICPRKIVKEPKILNPTPNAELDLNYRHDWANTVEEPTNSQFPSEIVAEEDEQATINESFAPITDQVEDLFFQTAQPSATKMHDNLPAGSRMEATAGTFNESNLNTQPKVCSNLDDLLDEMMDMGDILEPPAFDNPVEPELMVQKPVVENKVLDHDQEPVQTVGYSGKENNIENEQVMMVDEPNTHYEVPDDELQEPDPVIEPEPVRKEAPISLLVDGVVIEYDNLVKRKPNKLAVNFKRFKNKAAKFPRIVRVAEASKIQNKLKRNFDFDDD